MSDKKFNFVVADGGYGKKPEHVLDTFKQYIDNEKITMKLVVNRC